MTTGRARSMAEVESGVKLAALKLLIEMARANRRGSKLRAGLETRFAAALNEGATERTLMQRFHLPPERIAGLCMVVIRASA